MESSGEQLVWRTDNRNLDSVCFWVLAMLKPDSRVLWRLGVHLPSTEEQMVQVTLEHHREILIHNIHLRNGPKVD